MMDIPLSRKWIVLIIILLILIPVVSVSFYYYYPHEKSQKDTNGQHISSNNSSKNTSIPRMLNANGSSTEQPELSLSKNWSKLEVEKEDSVKISIEHFPILKLISESRLENISLSSGSNDSSLKLNSSESLQNLFSNEQFENTESMQESKNLRLARETQHSVTTGPTEKISIADSAIELTTPSSKDHVSALNLLLNQPLNLSSLTKPSDSVAEGEKRNPSANCKPDEECNDKVFDQKNKCASCENEGNCFQIGCEPERGDEEMNSILNQSEEILLVNTDSSIYSIPYSNHTVINEIFHSNPDMKLDDLSVDCFNQKIYFITNSFVETVDKMTEKYEIMEISYDGSKKTILKTDSERIEGISVDWISNNVFWTDSMKSTIEVANLRMKERKVLISDIFMSPKNIAVHPGRKKIFWYNDISPRLEWANDDGSDREVFLSEKIVKSLNSLAIDWETDELCWTAKIRDSSLIYCASIENRKVHIIVGLKNRAYNLEISPTHYYWHDEISEGILSMRKKDKYIEFIPLGEVVDITGIVAVGKQCPKLTNATKSSRRGTASKKRPKKLNMRLSGK